MYRLSKLIIILDINNTSNSGELQSELPMTESHRLPLNSSPD